MPDISKEERLKRLKAFFGVAMSIVKNLPSDQLLDMDGKVAKIRNWREKARKIIINLRTEALFSFCGSCFVVVINKRLDCDTPVFLSFLRIGKSLKFEPFTFKHHKKGSVRVECQHNKGNWVNVLNIDTMQIERDRYIIKAFSTGGRALKWLREKVEKG